MAISYEEVKALYDELEREHELRHNAHRELRDFWQGTGYWKGTDAPGSIASVFRDLSSKRTDVGPDIKLIHNVLQEVCVKYQTFLTHLPMIRVYVDPPESDTRRAQATLKERALYGLWAEGKMNNVANQVGWYLPLMGDCFLGIWPDFDKNIPVPVLRSPEYAFPVMNFDNSKLDALVFAWEAPLSKVKRAFPSFEYHQPQQRSFFPFRKAPSSSEPMIEVLEYSDDKEFSRFIGGTRVNGVEHDMGFNLFDQLSFIQVPDDPWNHGAVEQAVSRVEMGNALYSLMFQAVLENVFPTLFLINPTKAPETLDLGAGGVVGINEGGDAKWMAPPVQTVGAQMAFLAENERSIKQSTGMPDVNFGQFDASIITGKAINELQGAGTGSMVEMVQGTGIGGGLVSWNEKALYMLQTMFRDDNVYLHGIRPGGTFDLNPRQFGLKFKGSQIVGSQRNEVVFSPHLNMHEKLVMGLQAAGGGLVSKKYQREQIGIPDSEAMDEEILTEVVQDAVIGAMVQQLQAEPTPEAAAQVEDEAFAYMSGATTAHPLLSGPAGPGAAPAPGGQGGMPIVPLGPGAPGQASIPALKLPPGSPVPPGAGAPPQLAPPEKMNTGNPAVVTADEVAGAIRAANLPLKGRVFLVGEIAQRGQTVDDIELAVTDPGDKQTIQDALPPELAQRLVFHVVAGEPSEKHIEV